MNWKYKGDINRIKISGEISNLPELEEVKIVTIANEERMVLSFSLSSHRKKQKRNQETKIDKHIVVLFDDESFLSNAREGERYLFTGEIQSRNFSKEHTDEPVDEIIQTAVVIYREITGRWPIYESLNARSRKQQVDWREILKYGLIPMVPEDSIFDEEMKKRKDCDFAYTINADGEVIRETQHINYEIVVHTYEKISEPLDEQRGDINEVELCGRVAREPIYKESDKFPYGSLNIKTTSRFYPDVRIFFNNAYAWATNAVFIKDHIKKNDIVYLRGRFQSREYIKKEKKRHISSGGNRQTKVLTKNLLAKEISISKIYKVNL